MFKPKTFLSNKSAIGIGITIAGISIIFATSIGTASGLYLFLIAAGVFILVSALLIK